MLVPLLFLFLLTSIPALGLLFLFLWVALYRAPSTTRKSSLGRSAAVVVLGDIGRSPRMCNHVDSLANEGWRVAVVGYAGVAVPSNLRRSSIKHHHLATPPAFIATLPRLAFALVAPIKVLWQSAVLFLELTTQVQPPPELLLVQTPPALPTLFVVRLASLLLRSRIIIDWHNLAYTILALRMGANSPLVRIARHLERLTGKNAYAHLFVTHAMRTHLTQQWGLRGKKLTLYDRPPAHFQRRGAEETHQLWSRLAPAIMPPCDDFWPAHSPPRTTPFTLANTASTEAGASSEALLREDRPALVVSSTSWTADEDFSILLSAAGLYERRARELAALAEAETNRTSASSPTLEEPLASADAFDRTRRRLSSSSHRATGSGSGSIEYAGSTSGSSRDKPRKRASISAEEAFGPTRLPNEPAATLPKILILVTGKGELRAQYERQIAKLESEEGWKWVRIRTVWLEAADYPILLGSADVGVSLHTSSSGLDLPMKVVDMLGSELPVCALDFSCLDELVKDRRNGLIFRSAEELARQLESLLSKHPERSWLAAELEKLPSPFEVPLPGADALGIMTSTNGSGTEKIPSPPPTPFCPTDPATFTMMPSPVLGRSLKAWEYPRAPTKSSSSTALYPDEVQHLPSPIRSKRATSTWAGNWKRHVRPLLATDPDDAATSDAEQDSPGPGTSSGRSSLDGGKRISRALSGQGHARTGTLTSSLFNAQNSNAAARSQAHSSSSISKPRGWFSAMTLGLAESSSRSLSSHKSGVKSSSSPRNSGEVEREWTNEVEQEEQARLDRLGLRDATQAGLSDLRHRRRNAPVFGAGRGDEGDPKRQDSLGMPLPELSRATESRKGESFGMAQSPSIPDIQVSEHAPT